MTTPSNANGQRGAAEQNRQNNATTTGEQLREQVQAGAQQAAAMGKAQLDQHRQTAADQLDQLAQGARTAATELDQQDHTQMSHYLQELAGGMAQFASSLRDRNADELIREASNLARRNPGLFIAGSIAIGFGLARFLRASEHHHDTDQQSNTDRVTTPAHGLTGSGDYAAPPLQEDDFARDGLLHGGDFDPATTAPLNGSARYGDGAGQPRTGGPLS